METTPKFAKRWWMSIPGWCIWLALLLILILVRFNFSLHQFVAHRISPAGDSPYGDESPLYFVRQAVVDGICATAAMVLCLILAALGWKKYRDLSVIVVWRGWIWCMPAVVYGATIFARCTNLMDANLAETPWATYYDYHVDVGLNIARWGTLLFGLVLAIALKRKYPQTRLPVGNTASIGTQQHPSAG